MCHVRQGRRRRRFVLDNKSRPAAGQTPGRLQRGESVLRRESVSCALKCVEDACDMSVRQIRNSARSADVGVHISGWNTYYGDFNHTARGLPPSSAVKVP